MRLILTAFLILLPTKAYAPTIQVSFYGLVQEGHSVVSCERLKRFYESNGQRGICR